MKTKLLAATSVFVATFSSFGAHAEITLDNCVIREPAPGMEVTAAYLDINYVLDDETKSLRLPGPEELQITQIPQLSDVPSLHKTTMKDGVMNMQAIPRLRLKPGLNQLKPGGIHIMLHDLKKQPKTGESYPIEVWFSYNETLHCDALVKTSAEISEIYK